MNYKIHFMLSEKKYTCEVEAASKRYAERILAEELTKAMSQVNIFENFKIISVIEDTTAEQTEMKWTS